MFGTLGIVTLATATVHTMSILPSWLDPEVILRGMGGWAVAVACLIIFAECGLLVGFFMPGDSLLFTAGLFVATGAIATPLWLVCVLVTVCAFAGNVCGYWIGAKVGPTLFTRPDSRLFKQEYVDKTHQFFDKYGARAIVLARFVPIVRTFITAMAGVGRMDPRRYFAYSAVGGVLWATGVTILGFFLGKVEFVRANIEAMAILIVLVSVIPIIIELIRSRRERKRLARVAADEAAEVTEHL